MADHRIGFRDVHEESAVEGLAVEGGLPGWLSGTLVRNGPGRWDVGRGLRHWFDGLAMLHRFSFGGGDVSYASRFLRSPQYRSVEKDGKISYSEFATDPCRSIFKRLSSAFSSPGFGANASVSLHRAFEVRFVAFTETPVSVEFDPETLDTLGVVNFEDDLDVAGSDGPARKGRRRGEDGHHPARKGLLPGRAGLRAFRIPRRPLQRVEKVPRL